jgi:hypothetical protein
MIRSAHRIGTGFGQRGLAVLLQRFAQAHAPGARWRCAAAPRPVESVPAAALPGTGIAGARQRRLAQFEGPAWT